MKLKYIVMDKADNCATAIADIEKGEDIDYNGVTLKIKQAVALGHKFALKEIKKGDLVKKYGQIIGIATEHINKGEWIHTHNIMSHYLKEALNR